MTERHRRNRPDPVELGVFGRDDAHRDPRRQRRDLRGPGEHHERVGPTSRPASAAAAAISGAVCSIHSKDSGMISSRCRARTARMSAAVTGGREPRLGRA